jgi:putative transcriptional regulator
MSSPLYLRVVVGTAAQHVTNRVKAARVAAGLTQARLATDVGVSRQTVIALEAGNYAPSVYLALRIAAVLNTTVEALFAVPDESLGGTNGQEA